MEEIINKLYFIHLRLLCKRSCQENEKTSHLDKIFVKNQTVDILAKYWNEALDERVLRNLRKEEQVKIYTDKVADNIKFFNTDNDKKSGYIKLSQDAKEEFSKALSDKLINSESKTVEKDFAKYLHTLMVSDTGAETKVI